MRRKKQAASRAGMVVTTVALPIEMHRRLMIASIVANMAMTEVARVAFEEWMARRSPLRAVSDGSR